MEKWRVQCQNCQEKFVEVYPDGLTGDESFSDIQDPKTCDCESQYTLLERVE